MHPTRRYLATAMGFALTCAVMPVFGQTPLKIAGVENGPCMEGICEYRLANGMKVLLFPDASRPVTTVNLNYSVGSVHEGFGETGMAHLLEHLLFKGTKSFTNIPEEMKRRSMGFNATTSFDRTNYFASFPSQEDRLKWVLELEADRMVNSTFSKSHLDSEMTVVRNEMERGENDNARILQQRLMSTAFLWHPYRRSTIGARSDVENVGIDNLRNFYQRWYRPDNATLVVAGDFDAAKTLPLIQKTFAQIKNPKDALQKSYTVEPVQDGPREVILRRPGDVQMAYVGYHMPSAMHPDAAPLGVLGSILSEAPNGRIYKALVETKLAAGASLGAMKLKDPSLVIAAVSVDKDDDLRKAEGILIDLVEGIAKNPITQEELTKVLTKLDVARERMTENVNSVGQSLTSAIALGDWRMMFYGVDSSLKVTLEDVNRVAKTYFKPSNRTIARYIPDDTPDRAVIATALSASEVVKDYAGRPAQEAGESFEGTPENVTKRTQTFKIGQDLTVNFLTKKTRGNTVVVNADFQFASLADVYDRAADSAVGGTLMLGSKNYTRDQIKEKLFALKASGSASGGRQSGSVSINGKRETIDETVAFLAEVLREPTVPDSEIEVFRKRALTGIESSQKEPGTLASRAMGKHFDPYPKGHPDAYQTFEETVARIKAIDAAKLRAYHRDFYGTSTGQISVVGDFDPVKMRATLEKAFGSWNAPRPFVTDPTAHYEVKPEVVKIETPDKANAIVMARHNLSLNNQDPEYFPIQIAESILSHGMDSRLSKRLRVTEGLTYGVSASINSDQSRVGRDDRGSFVVSGTMAPQNVDKFVASMRDELMRFVRVGVTEKEVKDVKASMLESRRVALTNESGLSSILNGNAYYNRDMTYYAARTKELEAVTVDDVNRAIRKLIKPDQLSIYMAGDFAGAEKK